MLYSAYICDFKVTPQTVNSHFFLLTSFTVRQNALNIRGYHHYLVFLKIQLFILKKLSLVTNTETSNKIHYIFGKNK